MNDATANLQPSRRSSDERPARLLLAALLVVTFLLYLPTGSHDFVNFDDDIYVYENERVAEGLGGDNIAWAFSGSYRMGNWDPLNWLSLMATAEFFGLDPAAHHLVSVALHLANVALLFLFLRRATGALWPAFVAAAMFAWHPLQVETVAWVSERKGALSGFFWLLGMWLYAGYAERPSKARLAAVLTVFVLGLMSKPALLTFPFALLLLDVWPLRRINGGEGAASESEERRAAGFERLWSGCRRAVKEKLPMFAIVGVWVFVAHGAQTAVGAVGDSELAPWSWRLANAPVAYARHLLHFVWPSGLIPFYPHPGMWPWERVTAAVAFLVGGSALAARQLERRPFLAVGWFWFLGVLTPMIQLVQIGAHSMADRYFYLPMIGVSFVVVWGAASLFEDDLKRRRIVAPAAMVVLLGCLWATHRQIGFWRNTETLFSRTLAVSPANHVAHNNLGIHLMDQGRLDEAAGHFQASIRAKPGQPQALFNLGTLYSKAGRTADAIGQYRAALALDADYAKAHANLGEALARAGRLEEACASYEAALKLEPDNVVVLNNLGNALLKRGLAAEAEARLQEAVRIDPGWAASRYNLGRVHQAVGRADLAVADYREAVALKPDDAPAWNNLANALVDLGRREEALEAYRRSLELDSKQFSTRVNFAMTLEEAGRVSEAIDVYRSALRERADARTMVLLGGALTTAGRYVEAVESFRRVLRANPGEPAALDGAARILAAAPDAGLRDGATAQGLAARAVELTGRKRPEYLETLAAAQAESGAFAEAASIAEEASAVAARNGRPDLARRLLDRAETFRSGRPLRLGEGAR